MMRTNEIIRDAIEAKEHLLIIRDLASKIESKNDDYAYDMLRKILRSDKDDVNKLYEIYDKYPMCRSLAAVLQKMDLPVEPNINKSSNLGVKAAVAMEAADMHNLLLAQKFMQDVVPDRELNKAVKQIVQNKDITWKDRLAAVDELKKEVRFHSALKQAGELVKVNKEYAGVQPDMPIKVIAARIDNNDTSFQAQQKRVQADQQRLDETAQIKLDKIADIIQKDQDIRAGQSTFDKKFVFPAGSQYYVRILNNEKLSPTEKLEKITTKSEELKNISKYDFPGSIHSLVMRVAIENMKPVVASVVAPVVMPQPVMANQSPIPPALNKSTLQNLDDQRALMLAALTKAVSREGGHNVSNKTLLEQTGALLAATVTKDNVLQLADQLEKIIDRNPNIKVQRLSANFVQAHKAFNQLLAAANKIEKPEDRRNMLVKIKVDASAPLGLSTTALLAVKIGDGAKSLLTKKVVAEPAQALPEVKEEKPDQKADVSVFRRPGNGK